LRLAGLVVCCDGMRRWGVVGCVALS
jgi:hypothetical protein